jgi:tRNA threonylcarbamoyladenosine biosynthesis protein TsaB
MVVAEDARASLQGPLTGPLSVVMDARMGEVYGGQYAWQAQSQQWQATVPLQVGPPAQVVRALIRQQSSLPTPRSASLPTQSNVFAGNGFAVYPDAFSEGYEQSKHVPVVCVPAVPHALALLRLAPALWAAGQAVAPEDAQPLYIRDKVAQTTAEREVMKAAKQASAAS